MPDVTMACTRKQSRYSKLDQLPCNIFELQEKAVKAGLSIDLLCAQASSSLALGTVHQVFQFIERKVNMNQEVDYNSLTYECCKFLVKKISSKCFNFNKNGLIKICMCPKIKQAANICNNNNKIVQKSNTLIDCVECQCVISFKGYCASYVRTALINPTKQMMEHHSFMLMIENNVIENLKPGVKLCEVYNAVQEFANQKNENLAKYLDKAFGVMLSADYKAEYPPIDSEDTIKNALQEFRFPISNFTDDSMTINATNSKIAQDGMVFFINIKLTGLNEENVIDYCLTTGDTVMVLKDGPAKVLTLSKGTVRQCIIKRRPDESNN